jgi:hypothetical protein
MENQISLIILHQSNSSTLVGRVFAIKKLRSCTPRILRTYTSYIQFCRSENAAEMDVFLLARVGLGCGSVGSRLPVNVAVFVPRSCRAI